MGQNRQMAKLLGIDVGTSGCKVILIDELGAVLRQASRAYPLSTPEPMWSEQNPEDWWNAVVECLAEINEPNPDAIGVTGQMHGSVFLDDVGQVIRPAILWNDQRTSAECAHIEEVIGAERVKEITGNPPLTGFQLPKLIWLRNHEPSNFQRVAQVLLPKDYIRFRLSGAYATEVSDASGTGLLDLRQRDWSAEMLSKLALEASWFPKVFESDEVTSTTLNIRGLTDGIPIVGGGGDQAAGGVGTGAVVPGVISVSLGTSGVVFTALHKAEYDPKGAAHTFCHANRGWHAMGVMLSCGGALQWYRNQLGAGRSYDEIAASAASVAAGAEGLSFLPYLTGERCPHNDPFARGSFSGLTLRHSLSHLDRAVFEGLSFGLKDGFDLLKGLGATSQEVRVTSGGAKSAFWVQMLADIFGVPCLTLESDEGPAFGAAILAGVGVGVWSSTAEACKATIRQNYRFEPGETDYRPFQERYCALYPALKAWNAILP
jgi:xylulokinase